VSYAASCITVSYTDDDDVDDEYSEYSDEYACADEYE
jgi:hypothetical protein